MMVARKNEPLWQFFESDFRRLCDQVERQVERQVGANRSLTILELVREELLQRRQREKFFPVGLFGEPGWNILLNLYISKYEQRRTTVKSACIDAGCPATTALRYLKILEDMGLILRSPSIADARIILVALTPLAERHIENYFTSLRPQQQNAGP